MALLGLDAQPKLIDRLFDLFDVDGQGEIEFKEFSLRLKTQHSHNEVPPPRLQPMTPTMTPTNDSNQ
eukprot:847480-Prymnesium_polylepis.1